MRPGAHCLAGGRAPQDLRPEAAGAGRLHGTGVETLRGGDLHGFDRLVRGASSLLYSIEM